MRNANRILIGKSKLKRPLGRRDHRWEDNIKVSLKEAGRYDYVDCIHLTQVTAA
jgi:hypothetical protein